MRVTPECDPIDNFYISIAANVQFNPDIAFGSGNYMVVWTDGRAGSPAYRTYAARVTPSGTVLDPGGILVGPPDAGYQYSPTVVFNGTNFFTVWGYYYAPNRVMGRFINTNGSLSDTILIAPAGGYVYKTRVAYSGSNYLVAWCEYTGSGYNARGQILSTSGTPVGSPFTIVTGVYPYSLGLCYDGLQYCVSYGLMSDYQLYGRKYAIDGTPIDIAFPISVSGNSHYYCDIIPGADDCYLNVWTEYVSSYYDIYGNLDINIIGVDEDTPKVVEPEKTLTTILTGPLQLPAGKRVKIYDAMGRERKVNELTRGTYFLEIDGKITQKIVKVR